MPDMASIQEFKKALRKNAKTAGASYQKVDLHVHMPASGDYEYKEPDAFDQLGNVLNTNHYNLAVLLQHENFPAPENLERIRNCCPSTTILAGAEINVFVDVLDKKVSKDHFFHCIVIADPDQFPDPGYLIHRAKEGLTFRDSLSPSGFISAIDDVAKLFLEQGALFIPAHLHQSRSPELSRSIDDIYSDDDFSWFCRARAFFGT